MKIEIKESEHIAENLVVIRQKLKEHKMNAFQLKALLDAEEEKVLWCMEQERNLVETSRKF